MDIGDRRGRGTPGLLGGHAAHLCETQDYDREYVVPHTTFHHRSQDDDLYLPMFASMMKR
jgi:hypothetical protein